MQILEPGYAEQLKQWGLESLSGAFAFPAQVGPPESTPGWRRVAGGSTTSCYRLEPAAEDRARHYRTLYLKIYRYNPPSARYLLRASRATREVRNLRMLQRLGIHGPRVVAADEKRESGPLSGVVPVAGGVVALIGAVALIIALLMWMFRLAGLAEDLLHFGLGAMACGAAVALVGGLLDVLLTASRRNYLVGAALLITAIEPSQDLWEFAETRWRPPAEASDLQRAQIARLTGELAAQVAVLHGRRFAHKDLKFRNLLICWPRGQQPGVTNLRLAWIDCPRGQRMLPGPWLEHWKITDLADLDRNARPYTTRTQRLRFLRAYLRALGGEAAWSRRRAIVRKITARHARRAGRN